MLIKGPLGFLQSQQHTDFSYDSTTSMEGPEMKSKITSALLVLAIIMPGITATGQQPQQNDLSIAQLEAAIEKLEAVERDPTTPPEVRNLNSGFLQENRQRLRAMVENRVGALGQYLVNFRAVLTPSQVQAVEASIQKLQQHLSKFPSAVASDSGGGNEAPSLAVAESVTGGNGMPAATTVANESLSDRNREALVGPPAGTPPTISLPASAPASLARRFVPAPTNVPVQEFPTPQDCATYSAANPNTFSLYEKYVCDLVARTKTNNATGSQLIDLDQEQGFDLVVILMAQKLRSTFLVDAEEARVDKQVGATSSNAGTTSLVTKGGTPAILGFAVENGALDREISGTTVTFRGNPVGLIDALRNKGFISAYEDDSPSTRFLRKTSFAFSFDTDRGSDPGVFTAKRQQLSSVSARIEFINKRDPRSNAYKTDWENFLATKADAFLGALVAFKRVLTEVVPGTGIGLIPAVIRYKDQALQDWYLATQAEIANAAPGNVETVTKAQLAKLPIDELSPETVTALINAGRQFGAYIEGRDRILEKVANGTVATFEFTNKREVAAPDTSNFMGIYETAFGKKADFTFNGSLTIFNKLPLGPNPKRVRDFQFAGQLDLPFGDVNGAGQFVLSASGKYERLMQLASTESGLIVPNANGDIAIGQVKLTVPIKGLGIKLPISLSFANRTELIKERDVRGNFGFTFDLDTIFAKFKPF
jgi:hypothetical protein